MNIPVGNNSSQTILTLVSFSSISTLIFEQRIITWRYSIDPFDWNNDIFDSWTKMAQDIGNTMQHVKFSHLTMCCMGLHSCIFSPGSQHWRSILDEKWNVKKNLQQVQFPGLYVQLLISTDTLKVSALVKSTQQEHCTTFKGHCFSYVCVFYSFFPQFYLSHRCNNSL